MGNRLTYIAAGMLLLLVVVLLFSAGLSRAVVSPAGYYTESNGDIIEVCSDAACTVPTTSFNPGQTIYVRVTTNRVTNNGSGSQLRQMDFDESQLGGTVSWTKQPGGPPYVYTAAITAAASATKLDGVITYNQSVSFEEFIEISGLNQPFAFYADAARTDLSTTFRPGSDIYVTAYGDGRPYSASRTGNANRIYNFTGGNVYTWSAPAVTQTGNLYSFSLTLPSGGLTDGDWYWVGTRLRAPSGGGNIERMSRMIQIDGSSPVAAITSPAPTAYVSGNLTIAGTASDAFSFYNYRLEYGAGAAPATWSQIGATAYSPVTAGTLGSWGTTSVADGLYTLRLTVADRAYNVSTASVQVNVDNNPPAISSVAAGGITSSGANISWTTSEPADSQVEYGTSPGVYIGSTTLDPTRVVSHNQALTGLQQGTTYYYRVRSADAAGYVTYSAEQSFKTANLTILQLSPGLGKDTFLRSNRTDWNMGADVNLGAGDINAGDWGTIRGLLQFDFSTIPAGSTISSATMSLYQWYQGDASPQMIDAHYLARSWAEGTGAGSATADGATWTSSDGAAPWSLPGGDYNAGSSASTLAPNATNIWVDWDLTALTQAWVNGSVSNNGLLIRQAVENPAVTDAKGFYSSNYAADPSLRPKLVIEWLGDDVTGPAIGDVRSENVRTTTAGISWSTDEAATTQVEYGTTTSYGSTTPLDSSLVNQHAVPLTGLTENTLYHYRVRSVDPAGNETISGDHTFQTAVQVIIQPGPADGKDATIVRGQPTYNNGSWTIHVAGDLGPFWQSFRPMAQFDLSAIPAGSTVNSATISFYQYSQIGGVPRTLDLHYLTGGWTEGTGELTASGDGATWDTKDGASLWTTSGGDYDATASASVVAPPVAGAWIDWDVRSLAQGWIDGAIPNNGVIIKKSVENAASFDCSLFYSSEWSDPTLYPKLVVEYIPPPGSITLTVDETFNRDGTAGSGSVNFGSLDPGMTYYVGDTASPQYAVKLSVSSNINWGIKVSATDDLVHTISPANIIGIGNLRWKIDGGGVYTPFVKAPSETVILSSQPPTPLTSLMYDYEFVVPASVVSGNYATSIAYTAYTE